MTLHYKVSNPPELDAFVLFEKNRAQIHVQTQQDVIKVLIVSPS